MAWHHFIATSQTSILCAGGNFGDALGARGTRRTNDHARAPFSRDTAIATRQLLELGELTPRCRMPEISFSPAIPQELELPLPPVLNSDQLAVLLDRAPSTIRGDVSRAPYKLPPWCSPPGSTRKVWLTATVLSWLAAHETAPAAEPAAPVAPVAPVAPRPRRGRPPNFERAAAVVAGQEGGAK